MASNQVYILLHLNMMPVVLVLLPISKATNHTRLFPMRLPFWKTWSIVVPADVKTIQVMVPVS